MSHRNKSSPTGLTPLFELIQRARKSWERTYLPGGSIDLEFQRIREAETKALRRTRLARSGIENVISETDLKKIIYERLEPSRCIQTTKAWFLGPKPFLFLLGPTGCGKTIATGTAIAEKGGLYFRVQALERIFAARFGKALADLQAVLGTRLLVVDDIGTERYRALFTSILCELIDARQGVRRKTILTSNLTREQIEQRYPDDRLRSRLNQQAAFIGNDGPDMRRRRRGSDEARVQPR